jgi:hypothetical protein
VDRRATAEALKRWLALVVSVAIVVVVAQAGEAYSATLKLAPAHPIGQGATVPANASGPSVTSFR